MKMSENETRDQVAAPATNPPAAAERSTSLVPQTHTATALEVSAPVRDIAGAIAQLQDAIREMKPDDVVFEVKQEPGGAQHMRLRAYRSRL
jgi:hypothetical protein